MTKQICFTIILVLFLLNQNACQNTTTTIITPSSWTESQITSNCKARGESPKMIERQNSLVSLTPSYKFLQSSTIFVKIATAYTQNIFKFFVRVQNSITNLQISKISQEDGSKITQTYTIQNTYQFIDADGPYCLLQQTDSSGNKFVGLYSYDSSQSSTQLLKLSTSLNQYPNEILKYVQRTTGDTLQDQNYDGIKGNIVSINTLTNQTIVRPILADKIDSTYIYKFVMNGQTPSNSDIYTNLVLGVQISGNSLYLYPTFLYGSGDVPPFTYANDQTALSQFSGMYSNYIVIPFLHSMMIATWDDNSQNSNIFFLQNSFETYELSYTSIKQTSAAPSGSLQYLTDYSSFIIELNLDPTVNCFYILWVDDFQMYDYSYQNMLGDNNNEQIMSDFSNSVKVSSRIYGQFNEDNSYTSSIYIYIYGSNSITKYYIVVEEPPYINNNSNDSYLPPGSVIIMTINKAFEVDLGIELLTNSQNSKFEVYTKLACLCQVVVVSDFMCFSGNDGCSFVVQVASQQCPQSQEVPPAP